MRGLSIIKTHLSKYLSLLIPSGLQSRHNYSLISSKFFPVNICPDLDKLTPEAAGRQSPPDSQFFPL